MPNVKIRSLHGMYSTGGLFLEDGSNYLCPKLLPGQIVELPDDHICMNSPHIEITNEEPNRPYLFDTMHEAKATFMDADKAIQATQAIAASLQISAETRKRNKEALEAHVAAGNPLPPEPVISSAATDRAEGLAPAKADNAVKRETLKVKKNGR